MNLLIRSYQPKDYEELKRFYLDSSLYGGTFDEYRDGKGTLDKKIASDPEAILIAESDGKIIGSLSLIEDGRVAWLYRFAVSSDDVAKDLFKKAAQILRGRGHREVLVYSDPRNEKLTKRYRSLGFERGGNYVSFWRSIV